MRRFVTALVVAVLVTLTGGAAPGSTRPDDPRQDHGRAHLAALVAGAARSLTTVVGAVQPLAPDAVPPDVRPRGSWEWPLPGQPEVVKHFDPPAKPWLPGHRGVDLAGTQAAPVFAVDDGTVTYSGSIAGIGIVSITHPDGIRSTYQPVTDRIGAGDPVRAGQRIGHLGDFGSHCLLRLCLHLGAVRGEHTYLDPLLFLQPRELTLLPHSE